MAMFLLANVSGDLMSEASWVKHLVRERLWQIGLLLARLKAAAAERCEGWCGLFLTRGRCGRWFWHLVRLLLYFRTFRVVSRFE
jgi:hypothetical protein